MKDSKIAGILNTFSKDEIKKDVIQEMEKKVAALAIPRNYSYRLILIHVNGVKSEVVDEEFFSTIIDFGQFLIG